MASDVIVFTFALGPVVWIGLAVWFLWRQVKKSQLQLTLSAAAVSTQMVLIALPLWHHRLSVSEAGLSDFIRCPNNQEYCEEFWELAALDAQLLFYLGITFWVGAAAWLLMILLIPRNADVHP